MNYHELINSTLESILKSGPETGSEKLFGNSYIASAYKQYKYSSLIFIIDESLPYLNRVDLIDFVSRKTGMTKTNLQKILMKNPVPSLRLQIRLIRLIDEFLTSIGK